MVKPRRSNVIAGGKQLFAERVGTLNCLQPLSYPQLKDFSVNSNVFFTDLLSNYKTYKPNLQRERTRLSLILEVGSFWEA